jgi:hypothetical protein
LYDESDIPEVEDTNKEEVGRNKIMMKLNVYKV